MNLLEALNSDCIAIGCEATDKDGVLHALAGLAVRNPSLADAGEQALYEKLRDREALGSTGFGDGIAIPHAFLNSLDQFVVGVLVVPDGVPFEALDGKPVRVLVFIFGPSNRRNDHVRLLSSLSTILSRERAVQELCAATTPEVVRETLLRHEEGDVEENVKSWSMVHAFVQDEACFDDVLQAFSGAVVGGLSVIDASNARNYLNRIPVFSAFWTDSNAGFQRVVIGIVDSKLSNDVVRRIHTAAGREGREAGLMVTVQDLSYCTGKLNF